MPASHCPEVAIRWTHEYGNVQIRAWSQIHRVIREGILCHLVPSYDHPFSFSGSAGTSWALPKCLACHRIARRPREGSCSCWIRVSIFPFVRPSWGYLIQSCHIRVNFVWSSDITKNPQSTFVLVFYDDCQRHSPLFGILFRSELENKLIKKKAHTPPPSRKNISTSPHDQHI